MKIVFFGANSPTAQHLISMLSSNPKNQIIGLVRNQSNELKSTVAIKYIIYTLDAIEKIKDELTDADVWISFIGASGLLKARKVTDLYSKSAQLIIDAARIYKPKRVLWISSSGVVEQPNDGFFFKQILKPLFLKNMYKDMLKMETLITHSDLNYTIIRPPYLTTGKKLQKVRAQEFYFKDDQALNRLSLASYIEEELRVQKWAQKIVAVSG